MDNTNSQTPAPSRKGLTPPAGVPPLIPDPARLAGALGGPPLPVPQIGRPAFSRPPEAAAPLSATFAPTSGVSQADRVAIGNIRSGFNEVIKALQKAQALITQIDALEGTPELLAGSLNFDPNEARAFGVKCGDLLATITKSSN